MEEKIKNLYLVTIKSDYKEESFYVIATNFEEASSKIVDVLKAIEVFRPESKEVKLIAKGIKNGYNGKPFLLTNETYIIE